MAIIIFIFFTFNLYFNESQSEIKIPEKFSGSIIFHPKISDGQAKFILFSEELHSNVEIQIYKKIDVGLGDEIEILCRPIEDKNNYYNYLGVGYSVKNCNLENLTEKTKNPFITFASLARSWIIKRSDGLFTMSTSSLVKGLLIGDSNDIPEFIKNDYKNAGIMHIVAVSGFNMSVVAGFANGILKFISKKFRFILVTGFLFLYLSIVGFDNIPALKAFFLILIVNFAKMIGRRPNPVYATLVSSLIVLVIFPGAYTSISFQLSGLAGLAIAIFPQKFSLIMVNLFVLPVMILSFKTANPLGVLSNIVILPMVEPLTFLSISTLINPVNSFVVLNLIVDWLVRLIQSVAGFIASIPYSNVVVGQGNSILVLVISAILILLVFEYNYKKHIR